MAFISSSKKPLISLPLLAFITTYLMLLHTVNSQDVPSFTFDEFDASNDNLIYQGDASVSNSKALQLTRVDGNGNPLGGSVGRVLYATPVPLWDSSGGRLETLNTSFTFRISSRGASTIADGLTFFIASANSAIPPNSGGGYLGLFSNSSSQASSDKVFAVEFDTYSNRDIGDPDYIHVGIDINSIRSSHFRIWDWQDGQLATANIQYYAPGQTLRVTTSYPDGSGIDFIYSGLDLLTVLPEKVQVGFSASTGAYAQVNNVEYWALDGHYQRSYAQEMDGYIASVV